MTDEEALVTRLLAELSTLRLDHELLKAEHASCETLEFELKVARKELEEARAIVARVEALAAALECRPCMRDDLNDDEVYGWDHAETCVSVELRAALALKS